MIAAAIARRRVEGRPGSAAGRVIGEGEGWRLLDVVCTCDAGDPAAEERHGYVSVVFVLAGAFGYRSTRGHADLTAGSILFGTAGAAFECAHAHGAGDRCLAVQFAPAAFAELSAALALPGAARREGAPGLPRVALPVLRATTGPFALAEALAGWPAVEPEPGFELAVALAERVVRLAWDTPCVGDAGHRPGGDDARRMAEVVRWIEADPAAEHRLAALAAGCGMGRFHFVRRFRDVTGLTPYAFVRRARLRDAARLLLATDLSVSRVALEAGFADLSTFHAAFRHQFAASPRAFRRGGPRAVAAQGVAARW